MVKKFMKLCLYSSKTVPNSFHFDDFFFENPNSNLFLTILVRHLIGISGHFWREKLTFLNANHYVILAFLLFRE